MTPRRPGQIAQVPSCFFFSTRHESERRFTSFICVIWVLPLLQLVFASMQTSDRDILDLCASRATYVKVTKVSIRSDYLGCEGNFDIKTDYIHILLQRIQWQYFFYCDFKKNVSIAFHSTVSANLKIDIGTESHSEAVHSYRLCSNDILLLTFSKFMCHFRLNVLLPCTVCPCNCIVTFCYLLVRTP